MIIFIATLSRPFLACFGLKRSDFGVFLFYEFFCYFFFQFSVGARVGNDQNENFYFHSFSACRNLFWLLNKRFWCFFVFWIFLQCYFQFSIRGRVGNDPNSIFIFTLSRPLPTWFRLERSHNGVFDFFAIFFGIHY